MILFALHGETVAPPASLGGAPSWGVGRPCHEDADRKEKVVNNLNSVLIEGTLARDPELRYLPSGDGNAQGAPLCTLVLASTRTYKVNGERVEEVSFIESAVPDKLGEVCAEHLTKGRGVRVVGRLKQERWEDGDGYAREKFVIVAEHVEFQPQRAARAAAAPAA